MGVIANFLKWGFLIVLAIVFFNLFTKNAGTWGDGIGDFFTACQTFVTSLINSSPLS